MAVRDRTRVSLRNLAPARPRRYKEVSYQKKNKWPGADGIEQSKTVSINTKVTLKTLSEGDYFGEETVLGVGDRYCTVAASERTEVLLIDEKVTRQYLGGSVAAHMKERHTDVFGSEDEIQRVHSQRTLALERSNELLRSAFGPLYTRRKEQSKHRKK